MNNLNTVPARPLLWEEMHYRLVSLWDIMHLFKLNYVLAAVENTTSFRTTINNLPPEMLRMPLGDALRPMPGKPNPIDRTRKLTADMVPILREMGLTISAAGAEALVQAIDTNFTVGAVGRCIGDLHGRLSEEFLERIVLVVPRNKQEFYEQNTPLFGAEVATKFTAKGNFEIEEAGKSFALGRYTACAFHLMRTVECGLIAMQRALGLPDPTKPGEKTWGAVLGLIEQELERRENLTYKAQWNSMDDKRLFAQMHASVGQIKAWRDPTMHLESTYTEEEAQHLFALVKGFMQRVASRLDEDGQPLA